MRAFEHVAVRALHDHAVEHGDVWPRELAGVVFLALLGAAGLGVLEGVFVALLGPALGPGKVLAALIAYRALYYLAPLVIAAAAYFTLEAKARK